MLSRPLTESDLLAYASGEDLEEDVFDEITKQLAIVGSPAQRWMAELDAKSSRPFDIDWPRLVQIAEATSSLLEAERHTAHVEAEPAMPDQRATTQKGSKSGWIHRWQYPLVAAATILVVLVLSRWFFSREDVVVAQVTDSLGTITRDANGVHGLEAFPDAWRPALSSMVASGKVHVPQIALAFRGKTRGHMPYRTYLEPVGTVLRTVTPTFQWKSYERDASYEVLVYAVGQPIPVLSSGELSRTSWVVDRDDVLRRGSVYRWEVVVRQNGEEKLPDEAAPHFKILDNDELGAIKRVEEVARGSHLVLAAAYVDAGLLDDAEGELRTLVKDNPDSTTAGQLLESLRQQR